MLRKFLAKLTKEYDYEDKTINAGNLNFSKEKPLQKAIPTKSEVNHDKKIHTHIIGQSGTGKSKLQEYLIFKKIDEGETVIVLDAKNGLYKDILARLGKRHLQGKYTDDWLRENVVLVDFELEDYLPAINLLDCEDKNIDRIAFLVSSIKESLRLFYSKDADSWGVKIDQILGNALFSIINEGLTFEHLKYFIRPELGILQENTSGTSVSADAESSHQTDSDIKGGKKEKEEFYKKLVAGRNLFRESIITKYTDNIDFIDFYEFWTNEFRKWDKFEQTSNYRPLSTRLHKFLDYPVIKKAFCSFPLIDFKKLLTQKGKIILCNLNIGGKTILAEEIKLIGILLFNQIYQLLLGREEEVDNPEVHIFFDEFHKFSNITFADVVSLLRSKNVYFTISHQSTSQLELELPNVGEKLLKVIMENCSTTMVFRVEYDSAQVMVNKMFTYEEEIDRLAQRFKSPEVLDRENIKKLQTLENRRFYLKHMHNKSEYYTVPDVPPVEEAMIKEEKRMTLKYLFDNVFNIGYPYFVSKKAAEIEIAKIIKDIDARINGYVDDLYKKQLMEELEKNKPKLSNQKFTNFGVEKNDRENMSSSLITFPLAEMESPSEAMDADCKPHDCNHEANHDPNHGVNRHLNHDPNHGVKQKDEKDKKEKIDKEIIEL